MVYKGMWQLLRREGGGEQWERSLFFTGLIMAAATDDDERIATLVSHVCG